MGFNRCAMRRWLPALYVLTAALGLTFSTAGCGGTSRHARVNPPEPPATAESKPPSAEPAVPVAASPVVQQPAEAVALLRDEFGDRLRPGAVWQEGWASYYGIEEQGRTTASGEVFDFHKLTAAHRTLPIGTIVKVTNLRDGRSVVVRINDRGPFWPHRVLDLSVAAAKQIGVYEKGLERVRIEIVSLPLSVPPGRYTVQVGWFHDTAAMKRCRELMSERLHQPVAEFTSSDGHWLRYYRHTWLDRATAVSIAHDLRAHQFPAYIVRLN